MIPYLTQANWLPHALVAKETVQDSFWTKLVLFHLSAQRQDDIPTPPKKNPPTSCHFYGPLAYSQTVCVSLWERERLCVCVCVSGTFCVGGCGCSLYHSELSLKYWSCPVHPKEFHLARVRLNSCTLQIHRDGERWIEKMQDRHNKYERQVKN